MFNLKKKNMNIKKIKFRYHAFCRRITTALLVVQLSCLRDVHIKAYLGGITIGEISDLKRI